MLLDELNFSLAIDQFMENGYGNLDPYMSSFDMGKPRTMSDNMAMPKPVVATIANWIGYEQEPPDPIKWEKMLALLS